MLKLKLASALLAALFASAGSVYAAGGAVAPTDSGGLSDKLLPKNTHATPPVGFPTSGMEIGNESQEWRTDRAIPGIVAVGGHVLDLRSFPDGARVGPPGN